MTQSLLTRPDRLAALRRTALLDSPPEESFDRLTRMAARLLGTPVSLITLVADDHQFFKSAIGLPEPWATRRVTPISFSFCGQVVASGEALVLEDARRHPLLRHNPAIRELGWLAYAGVPLITRHGHAVGSFAVIDRTPRLWSERDIALLQDLAASAVAEIELRSEIAERRHAEQGRRESEEQFHSTFEQSGIGMALISPDGRWVRVNRALCEMLECARDDLVGFSVEGRTHPADQHADQEAIRLLLAGEVRTYTMEKRYVGCSGRTVWALVNVSLVPGPAGEPSHLIAGIQEITDRKHVEEAQRATAERYCLVAKASGEAIRDWDLQTDRLTWDEGSGSLLDYQRSELGDTAAWWYDRIHPDDRERMVASIGDAVGQGGSAWSDEYRFRRGDGSYSVVLDRAHISHDESGNPVRVIAAISEAYSANRIEHQLEPLLDALPVGVWVVDAQGGIVVANSSSRQLLGGERRATLANLTALKASWADNGEPVRPDEWGAARALRGEISVDEEMTIEISDGARKIILSSATPIWGAAGQILGAVAVLEDVTERKAAESDRLRRDEHVKRFEKLEAVGRLAGGIAHDFNNLLTGILSYSDLILQELRAADPIRADVEQIRDAGNRAANLTRQLLAFSRRQLLQPRVVSLNATIADLEPMLGRLLGPGVTLETELDPSVGNVMVDPAGLEQVFVHLAVNARDAMANGGRATIGTATVWLDAIPGQRQATGGAAYVSVAFSDTGIGMDESTQARIFEPFFTSKPGASGTGLGLSTVYGIVEQSGGQVTVDSVPGEGATFTVYLPLYAGPEPAVKQDNRPSAQRGTETLLLVEDEAPVRESVRRLLEWHGYTVIEARNGAEALRVYEENEEGIDLVLTDLAMPEMGGAELVERLRARRPNLRVLFMSGYTEKPVTTNGATPPDTAFVEKPFTVETLMRRLREVLDG